MSIATPRETTTVGNVIDGDERPALAGATFAKLAPATGEAISEVARSGPQDVEAAVAAAKAAQPGWAATTPVERGLVVRRIAALLERDLEKIAAIVAAETGKAPSEARAETGGAIEMGYFVAGEGRRLYGRTTTSAVPGRQASTIRQPVGVAGLIIAANTPIANVAWKVFPAVLCGNAAVLKASEDTPETALAFARLAHEAGLPPGVLNVVNGLGEEAGQPLVEHPDVDLVSFTGSTAVGRMIARVAGERLARVCLELGGKNPLVVCDDADLERAADAAVLSAFSNAGQRCAAASRLVVFAEVYDRFVELLLARTADQKVGPGDEHDFGPVINERQLEGMLAGVEQAREAGARDPHRRRAPRPAPATTAASSWRRRSWRASASTTSSPARSCSARSPPSTGSRASRRRSRLPTTRPTGSPRRSGRRTCTGLRSSWPGRPAEWPP